MNYRAERLQRVMNQSSARHTSSVEDSCCSVVVRSWIAERWDRHGHDRRGCSPGSPDQAKSLRFCAIDADRDKFLRCLGSHCWPPNSRHRFQTPTEANMNLLAVRRIQCRTESQAPAAGQNKNTALFNATAKLLQLVRHISIERRQFTKRAKTHFNSFFFFLFLYRYCCDE